METLLTQPGEVAIKNEVIQICHSVRCRLPVALLLAAAKTDDPILAPSAVDLLRISHGREAEAALWELLELPYEVAGVCAINALGRIGTIKSIAALHRAKTERSGNFPVSQANRAIEQIKRRFSATVDAGAVSIVRGDGGELGRPPARGEKAEPLRVVRSELAAASRGAPVPTPRSGSRSTFRRRV